MEQHKTWSMSGLGPECYDTYIASGMFAPLARRLLERIPLHAGHRVLDVACGTGIVARLAAPRVAPSGKVVGVDIHEGMLAVARARSAGAGACIEWQQGDATALPFADAAFDVILCQQGLQFFADTRRALKEMQRVATRGGTIALSVFGATNRFSIALAEALEKYVDAQTAKRSLQPFAFGDAALLRATLDDAGLGGIEIETVTLTRRVEPTQEWLLQRTGGLPYAAAIAALKPIARADMVREIAAKLKEFWDTDSFAVPTEAHLVYARNHGKP